MSKINYYVIPVKRDDFFVFKKDDKDGLLMLLDVRPSSATDAVLFCTRDMVERGTLGTVLVEKFPTDFLFVQLVNQRIPFREK